MLQAWGLPESNQDFVSARSQEISVKKRKTLVKNMQGGYAQEAVSHEQQLTRTVNVKITRSTKLQRVTRSASLKQAEDRESADC